MHVNNSSHLCMYVFCRRDCVVVFAVCEMNVCLLCRSTLKSASQRRNCSRALAASSGQAGKHVAPTCEVQDYLLLFGSKLQYPSGSLPSDFTSTFFFSIAANVAGIQYWVAATQESFPFKGMAQRNNYSLCNLIGSANIPAVATSMWRKSPDPISPRLCNRRNRGWCTRLCECMCACAHM